MMKAASMIGLLFAPCINLFATTSDQMSPTHRTGENYELRQQLGRLQQRLHETETNSLNCARRMRTCGSSSIA